MATKSRTSRYFDIALIFALVYILSQLAFRQFFPSNQTPVDTGLSLRPATQTVRLGAAAPLITLHNGTSTAFALKSRCPQPPLDVFSVTDPGATSEALTPLSITGSVVPCDQIEAMPPLASGKDGTVNLNPWKYTFAKAGTYEVRLPAATGSGARFTMIEPNSFVKLFRAVLSKPFLNFLILTASMLPNHSLGIGIIILTLLVKLLLFIPTQHALEGQKKMQLLQPKLEAVRKQYKEDPKRMQEETMKLWKEHGVNPLQSCLPILVQFPVLIGLFYVIRDGSNLALSRDLIYPIYQHLTWNFNTSFLGLNLTKPSLYIFPPLLVFLQFIQMKLSFMIADKKKAKQIEKAEAKTGMETQQKIMLYVLPLMIGFFALRFPSAVSLYWGISTLFAIGQQMIVNKEHLKA